MNNQTKWYDPIMLGAIAGSGEFSVICTPPSFPIDKAKCKLHGFSNGKLRVQISAIFDWIDAEDCTLIARSIDDMTSAEWKEVLKPLNIELAGVEIKEDGIDVHTVEGYHERTNEFEFGGFFINWNRIPFNVMINFYSIGVWVGDWHRVVKG